MNAWARSWHGTAWILSCCSVVAVAVALAASSFAVGAAVARGGDLAVDNSGESVSKIDLGAGDYDSMLAGGVYNDQLGNDLAAGDVNDDRVADLVLGAHWSGGAGRNIVGRAYVVFGRELWPQSVDLNNGTADWSIRGAGREARFGSAVASGMLDEDTVSDLLVGALLADPFDQTDAGAAAAMFGGRSVSGEIDLENTAPDVLFAGESRTRNTDQLGSDAAVCDLNGDGTDDVAVAAANRGDGHGAVFVWWGPFGSGDEHNLQSESADWSIVGSVARMWLGSNIACGDVDEDGHTDLLMSTGRATAPDAPADLGAVLVFRGGPTAGGLVEHAQDRAYITVVGWTGAMLGMSRSTIRSGRGRPILVADVTGDGHADLVIGSPLGEGRRGSVVVLPGPIDDGTVDLATAKHLRVTTDAPESRLGWSVSAGHLDGDGTLDIAIAASGATVARRERAGMVVGVRGPLASSGELALDSLGDLLVYGPQPSAGNAGVSLLLHDVTGDGHDDLAMGFPDAAPYGRNASGAVYLLAGPILDDLPTPSATPSATPVLTPAATPVLTPAATPVLTPEPTPGSTKPATPFASSSPSPASSETGHAPASPTSPTSPNPTSVYPVDSLCLPLSLRGA